MPLRQTAVMGGDPGKAYNFVITESITSKMPCSY